MWGLASAFLSGTLHLQGTTYELLDRLGVIPFWLFFLAPLAFATEHQRRILLGTLVALGAYLGATALFETLKLYAFVWPKYILDPAYGSHGDRARGPFVEAIANGMGLFACAVAAGMAMAVWRDRPRVRNACGAVLGLCAAGCLFTLTREVWLGAAIGGLAAMAGFAELRRFLLPAIAVGAAMTVIALAAVPGFAGSVHSRTHDDSSLWVRKNVARAAVNMIDAKPLLGFGWNGFVPDSGPRSCAPRASCRRACGCGRSPRSRAPSPARSRSSPRPRRSPPARIAAAPRTRPWPPGRRSRPPATPRA